MPQGDQFAVPVRAGMLEAITVRNFQRHKKRAIRLDPQITTLVGRSDAGKSSLLRAVKWVATNRASRNAVRKGASWAKAVLGIDGRRISRTKGKGKNAYALDGKTFGAIGTNVPGEIADLLNLGIENFGGQHASPFWFSLTAGQLAKELNRIVNLDLIDRTLAAIAAGLRGAKSEAEVSKRRLAAAREERDGLAWVKDAEAEHRILDQVDKDCEQKRLDVAQLEEMLRVGELAQEGVENAADAGLDAGRAVLAGSKAAESSGNVYVLAGILDRWEEVEDCIAKWDAERAGIERQIGGLPRCPLCGKKS